MMSARRVGAGGLVLGAVAFDGADYLVAWTDARAGDGSGRIYGARVRPAGEVRDPDGFAVADAGDHQYQLAATAGGTAGVAVAYARAVSERPYGVSRVFLRLIDASAAMPTPTPTPSPTPAPTGCATTNGSDVPIPDLTTVESALTIAGCTGNASANTTVEIHIVHTYLGDLVVTLVAPDGSTHVLQSRQGGSADNIDQTYTVDLSSQPADGTWRLRVQDAAAADVGRIDSWTLKLQPHSATRTTGLRARRTLSHSPRRSHANGPKRGRVRQ